jgi:hypothetical protein
MGNLPGNEEHVEMTTKSHESGSLPEHASPEPEKDTENGELLSPG